MSMVTTNGEKMALNINVQIENSEALHALTYNSDTKILFITFKHGGTYQHDGVTVAEMLGFVATAIEKNSWGKSYHAWRNLRERYYTEVLQTQANAFIDSLHPTDRLRAKDAIDKALRVHE